MVLVDSSVWIDYFNGVVSAQTDALDALLATEPVLIGDLILTEVLQGFRSEAGYRQARELLCSLSFCQLGGHQVALAAADNDRHLRARGITVRKTIDVIIATHCLLMDQTLLHSDRDFDSMERILGLQVHPSASAATP
ncbi:type II toxin-antitoxin system VapC family toxin [Thiocystis violacea]|uniref:type II toxin-antitoxin system VapC family toxin n=1 Tax=Thiocystis violacea TaxID=13725 RepID=UPI001907EA44|nr:PIN domain nuclease [Thiocystis violacea]MBK1724911.1 VapC toxin family PIN domain ribonuclease [Thiocystis violacea]